MRAQWIVPITPYRFYGGGLGEDRFAYTGGWQWEEANWAGRHVDGDDSLSIFSSEGSADVTVFSPEGFAVSRIGPFRVGSRGRVLVRCVGSPPAKSDGNGAWDMLARCLPAIDGLCAIGEVEASLIRSWAQKNGHSSLDVMTVPLGAEVFPGTFSPEARHGFAYLGSAVATKRVPVLMEAATHADVHLTIALAIADDIRSIANLNASPSLEAYDEIRRLAGNDKRFVLTQVGAVSRVMLLHSVRGAVTMSHADTLWLPGVEARACGGIAIAAEDPLIRRSNGDAILFTGDSVKKMASALSRLEREPDFYAAESIRQHDAFCRLGLDSASVGAALWKWVRAYA